MAPHGGGAPGFPPEDVEQGKMWALLGYIIMPLFIIPLIQRDNAFGVYHAKQALVLFLINIVGQVIAAVVTSVTCGVGFFIYFALLPLIYPWIMGIIASANGEYKPLPWIGHFADQWFSGMQADKRPGSPGAPPPGQMPPGGMQ